MGIYRGQVYENKVTKEHAKILAANPSIEKYWVHFEEADSNEYVTEQELVDNFVKVYEPQKHTPPVMVR